MQIIWTLTLIVTVKYILIVLRADDEGEGGTFAMYTLLSRFSNIVKQDPATLKLIKMERYNTNELGRPNRSIRRWLEQSVISHAFLKVLSVFGVSLIMADGILTPAQSVLGAIQGLEVVKPDITNGTIVGASCGISILLFLVQPFGIHRISSVFAPVVIIWLLFNAGFGIYNLAVHDWTVLTAFSPYFAGDWFVRNKTGGWIKLGGILLAFTGVEALFADLGVSLMFWRVNADGELTSPAGRPSLDVRFSSRGCVWHIHACCLPTLAKLLTSQGSPKPTTTRSSTPCLRGGSTRPSSLRYWQQSWRLKL